MNSIDKKQRTLCRRLSSVCIFHYCSRIGPITEKMQSHCGSTSIELPGEGTHPANLPLDIFDVTALFIIAKSYFHYKSASCRPLIV